MEFELKEASSPVSKTTKSDLGVSMNLTDVDLIGTEMNAVGISLLVYHTVIWCLQFVQSKWDHV